MVAYACMLAFGILCVHNEGETVVPLIAVTIVFLVAALGSLSPNRAQRPP